MSRAAMRTTYFARPIPDLVIIGAMKCGTTSLYHYLLQHPDIRGAVRKEVSFLDRYWERGERWYRAQFPVRVRRRWIGVEATPFYLSYAEAPQRLAAVAPDAHLVVVLRDPAERAVSQWRHRAGQGRDRRSFEEVLAAELSSAERAAVAGGAFETDEYRRLTLAHGFYAHQLRRWFDHYPGDRFTFLDSVDLALRPNLAIEAVLRAVDLDTHLVPDTTRRNESQGAVVSDSLVDTLRSFYSDSVDDLATLLPTRFSWYERYGVCS